MRPRDRNLAEELDRRLDQFDRQRRALPGVRARANRQAFIEQVLESIHRVTYISVIVNRDIGLHRADPSSEFFDPLKAAILRQRAGENDEAFWLVFLFVHFGKHRRAGWQRIRDVYGCLGGNNWWDWRRTSADPARFRHWLGEHENEIGGHFGNHRKYESLSATSNRGTGAVVESYVQWINPPRTHEALMQEAQERGNMNPAESFDYLYHEMDHVISFGRMAKFDYLSMLGKLELANIAPGTPYFKGATGPLTGARLLFGNNNLSAQQLDIWVAELGTVLEVGMQVLEDSLCNWQKTPERFIPFRG